MILFFKAHIAGYTRKDGTYVRPYITKRSTDAKDTSTGDLFAEPEFQKKPQSDPEKIVESKFMRELREASEHQERMAIERNTKRLALTARVKSELSAKYPNDKIEIYPNGSVWRNGIKHGDLKDFAVDAAPTAQQKNEQRMMNTGYGRYD